MSKELAKTYDPHEMEDRIYQKWLDKKYFHAEVDKTKKPFTIVIPPPNITGQLHMGHALDNTMQDILIRFKRMQGYNVLWQPGTDHASIATEVKIIQKLKEEGIDKHDLGREKFLERAWDWKKEYGGRIISQLKKLPMFMERRKAIVKQYNEAFSKLPQIVVQKEIPESDTTRHLYILRINPEKLSIDRRQFFDALAAENICCNVHYIPTYYFPYYEKLGYKRGLCPKAEKLYEEILTLPLYYSMTDQDVADVIEAVTKIAVYYSR